MSTNIKELAKNYEPYITDMRREFHMHPETSLHEERTAARVAEELEKMGIPLVRIAGTGVLGTIHGKFPGKTIALRADMDALEITEKTDLPFKSKNDGVMHACGHDSHTAMLLGGAKILNEIKDQLHGTVKLIFQPAEEVAQGAKRMIAEGAMEGVDEIFGMHVMGDLPAGKIALHTGPLMAAVDMFKLTIKGKGGHGSMPNYGVDAVVAASAVVMNLQTIASRESSPMEPVVVSVGKFVSGTRFNILADEAVLEGTVRCFSHQVRRQIPEAMERIAKSTAASYRAEAELEYTLLTAPLINVESSVVRARKSVAAILSEDAAVDVVPTTGGEDFSEYMTNVPGVFAFVGICNEEKDTCYSIHHPKFTVDEDMLKIGAALHAQYAWDFLNES